jgi:hypothetical protein
MGHRYCPQCEEWLSTAEYTVDESGETVCPQHKAVHGFIIDTPWSVAEFRNENPSWYDDQLDMLNAAKRQGLVR